MEFNKGKVNVSYNIFARFGRLPLVVDRVHISRDEKLIAIATPDSGISIWDIQLCQQVSELEVDVELFKAPATSLYERELGPFAVRDLAFSADNLFLAVALNNDEVHIWIREGTLVEVIKRPAVALTFMPSHNIVALCFHDGHIEFWEFLPARFVSSCPSLPDAADPLCGERKVFRSFFTVSEDGKELAVLLQFARPSSSSLLQIYDCIETEKALQVLKSKTMRVPHNYFQFISYFQKRWVFFGGDRYSIFCINTQSGDKKILDDIKCAFDNAHSLSPDGQYFVVSRVDGTLMILDSEEGKALLDFKAHQLVNDDKAISAVFWLRDGGILTVGTDNLKQKNSLYENTTAQKWTTIKIWKCHFN
ncbi:WD40 repeat domain-containing protein [Tengunoibacter tsumagoiensis]|nr:hypothetical protein [Tengunoibacter tsumagoiensis]